ncbi:unnamed protein product [Menidia menidia]|uniref:(Atlantic silverside) hypothetical protein n=1 Tax=Menidia menidia TaxID=238744 RepID=A0A8S4B5M0_9TELE|nr:unnamed protein product [Menidia menidia]
MGVISCFLFASARSPITGQRCFLAQSSARARRLREAAARGQVSCSPEPVIRDQVRRFGVCCDYFSPPFDSQPDDIFLSGGTYLEWTRKMTDPSQPDPVPDQAPPGPDPAVLNGMRDPADPQKQEPEPGAQSLKMDQEMKITDSVDEGGLLESSMRLKPHEAQSYRKKALWVSWVSIVITIALAIAAFTVSIMRHSASAFGFAFDAVLDVLSSVIVLWRYSNAAAVHSAHREYIACVILGVIFILSSMCIMGKAIHDLATKLLPEVVRIPTALEHIGPPH